MKIVQCLIYMFFVLFHTVSLSQILWQNTEYGMSVDDVRKINNLAMPIELNVKSNLTDGSQKLLKINSIDIANHNFSVDFYFLQNKLTQVNLKLEDKLQEFEGFHLFRNIFLSLVSKYGKEISRKEHNSIGVHEAVWVSGKTNIKLLLSWFGKSDAVIYIYYRADAMKDAGNL